MDRRETVAFLGPTASYTHQAALDFFDEAKSEFQPEVNIEDVFSAVQRGATDYGVVPFENSTNGSVVFTLDLFADLKERYPDILVCGECYVRVQHCLLGRASLLSPPKSAVSTTSLGASPTSSDSGRPSSSLAVPELRRPRTKPISDLSHVRKIYSHPQAWGQCKAFLDTYLKGVERQDCSSTSRAAEEAANDPAGTSAAISSAMAAQMHGLDYLARGIEDNVDNTTRFFVIRRKVEREAMTRVTGVFQPKDAALMDDNMDRYKTMISFTVDHYDPGALADALAVFKPYHLNLTSINTRPSGVEKWNYIFFVEFKGRRLTAKEGAVNAALGDLSKVVRSWRWLGSWERRLAT